MVNSGLCNRHLYQTTCINWELKDGGQGNMSQQHIDIRRFSTDVLLDEIWDRLQDLSYHAPLHHDRDVQKSLHAVRIMLNLIEEHGDCIAFRCAALVESREGN